MELEQDNSDLQKLCQQIEPDLNYRQLLRRERKKSSELSSEVFYLKQLKTVSKPDPERSQQLEKSLLQV